MKKLFALLAIVALLLPSCQKINDRLDAIDNRLDNIEGTQIASLQQQIDAINTTLPQLKQMDAELKNYIESLQTTATGLQQQIIYIGEDIDELEDALDRAINDAEDADNALKAELISQLQSTKSELEAELTLINSSIETLTAADAELEQKITVLEEYVNTELKNTEDWVSATFATLEQYNSICTEIATINQNIETLTSSITELEERINTKIANDIAAAAATLDATIQAKVTEITNAYTSAISTATDEITEAYTAAIATSIANLESSMKEWVNNQLTGYYTIAETEAALELLKDSITSGDAAFQEIELLSQRLESMKTEITEAYQVAIFNAIVENNGVIDVKIANQIALVNSRIDSEIMNINSRIDALEDRLDEVEDIIKDIQALDIIFENSNNLACLAGASVEVSYTIIGGDEKTEIECWGNGGWDASIIKIDSTTGKIKITAPYNATSGKVVVLATSGVGGVAMKSLHFDKGVITEILDSYEVDWAACNLDVIVKTNLSYTVNIPGEAQEWISCADTRVAMHTDTLTFSIGENDSISPRSATIELIGECGDVLYKFSINQYLHYIEFEDAVVKEVCVSKFDINGDGEISYTEALNVTSIESTFFGDCNKNVTSFNELCLFRNIERIEASAFAASSIESITLPMNLTSIESSTFIESKLKSIIIPEGVTSIGSHAFYGTPLERVTIPNSVMSIDYDAFYNCGALNEITFGSSIETIGYEICGWCTSLKKVYCKSIEPPVLGNRAFAYYNSYGLGSWVTVSYLESIYVPMESVDAYKSASGWSTYSKYIVGYDFED